MLTEATPPRPAEDGEGGRPGGAAGASPAGDQPQERPPPHLKRGQEEVPGSEGGETPRAVCAFSVDSVTVDSSVGSVPRGSRPVCVHTALLSRGLCLSALL